ncbi:MAG TPA: hypothetical protein VKS24_14810, partial [Bradyrhizobium sp.]|nr:hypothetical protein [Bradyrhizobium sp.]
MIASRERDREWSDNGQEGFGRPAPRHDGPHRKKHGNTRVGTLRRTHGKHFAKGRRKDMMLKSLLAETGTDSPHANFRKHH